MRIMADGTAAPVASLTPVSSWVRFEVSRIQAEIDKLNILYPDADGLTIVNGGLGAFLETIAYTDTSPSLCSCSVLDLSSFNATLVP
jgi:Na+/H+ antiporter NhaC